MSLITEINELFHDILIYWDALVVLSDWPYLLLFRSIFSAQSLQHIYLACVYITMCDQWEGGY